MANHANHNMDMPMEHNHNNHGHHAMADEVTLNTLSADTMEMLNNLTSVVPDIGLGHDIHAGHEGHDGMDHSNMDHGNMDHGNMDHGNHGSGGGMHDMMTMYFHFGYSEPYVLFYFWQISTVGGLIGSMIGLFLIAMLYEGLKVLREYLLQRTVKSEESLLSHQNGSSSSSSGLRVPLAGEDDSVQTSNNVVVVKSFFRPNPFSLSHIIQTVLHMVQLTISYVLMLIFMTYNVWLCLAVVLGAGAGYFTFGWRKRTIVDINEHCH